MCKYFTYMRTTRYKVQTHALQSRHLAPVAHAEHGFAMTGNITPFMQGDTDDGAIERHAPERGGWCRIGWRSQTT